MRTNSAPSPAAVGPREKGVPRDGQAVIFALNGSMRALAIALLGACGALCEQPAFASDARPPERIGVSLVVERGPGTEQCIDARTLEQAVEVRLHKHAFSQQANAALQIHVHLTHPNQRSWSSDLRLEGEHGENLGQRTITTHATHCSALDDSLALVVALLVDAPLEEREQALENARALSPAEAPPQPSPASALRPPPAIIELPPNTVAPRQPWRWEATAGMSLAWGLLPGTGFGLELGLSGRPPRGPELRLFAQAYAPREAHAGPNDAGARFDAWFAGLEICPFELELSRLRLEACGGQNLGRLHAAAFGYDQNSSESALLFSILTRGVLVIPLFGPLGARLSARAELPLSHPVFYYGATENTEHSVFELSPVLGVLEAGLSVAL